MTGPEVVSAEKISSLSLVLPGRATGVGKYEVGPDLRTGLRGVMAAAVFSCFWVSVELFPGVASASGVRR